MQLEQLLGHAYIDDVVQIIHTAGKNSKDFLNISSLNIEREKSTMSYIPIDAINYLPGSITFLSNEKAQYENNDTKIKLHIYRFNGTTTISLQRFNKIIESLFDGKGKTIDPSESIPDSAIENFHPDEEGQKRIYEEQKEDQNKKIVARAWQVVAEYDEILKRVEIAETKNKESNALLQQKNSEIMELEIRLAKYEPIQDKDGNPLSIDALNVAALYTLQFQLEEITSAKKQLQEEYETLQKNHESEIGKKNGEIKNLTDKLNKYESGETITQNISPEEPSSKTKKQKGTKPLDVESMVEITLGALGIRCDELKEQCKDLEEELKFARTNKETAEENYNDAIKKLGIANKEIAAQRTHNSELRAQIREYLQKNDELIRQITQLSKNSARIEETKAEKVFKVVYELGEGKKQISIQVHPERGLIISTPSLNINTWTPLYTEFPEKQEEPVYSIDTQKKAHDILSDLKISNEYETSNRSIMTINEIKMAFKKKLDEHTPQYEKKLPKIEEALDLLLNTDPGRAVITGFDGEEVNTFILNRIIHLFKHQYEDNVIATLKLYQ
ncbi:MAG: hypothetical protein ACP5N3_04540 [Candidatus Nanoarchaeia archaeon]